MTATVFNHPWLSALLGDDEVSELFSLEAELEAMLAFEAALASAQAAERIIPPDAATAIERACETFVPDHAGLRQGAGTDGLVVPALVKQLRRAVGPPHDAFIHFGSTSQDVIDTALMLRLKKVIALLDGRLEGLIAGLKQVDTSHGRVTVMGRTRMQDALPIPLSYRIETWREPLIRHRRRLADLAPRLLCVQFGGPVGIREKFGDSGTRVAARLAQELALGSADLVWQATRDNVVEFSSLLALITGSLGKLGADIALMAQPAVGEARVAGAGGSSAMAHKQNPIAAEALVTFAHYNATLSAGMQHAMVHEGERSGSMWTLEWMLLPQMCVVTGAATRQAARLLASLEIRPRP